MLRPLRTRRDCPNAKHDNNVPVSFLETYLEERVETLTVHVHVYVNHGNEPDQIAILLGTGAS